MTLRVERLSSRPDLAASLNQTDQDYVAACRKAEADANRRTRLLQVATYTSLVAVIIGLVGWMNQATIAEQWRWWTSERPFAAANIWPYTLDAERERTLKPGDSFWECTHGTGKDLCPEMVVIPAGTFMMGAAPSDKNVPVGEGPMHQDTISPTPQHEVTIAKPLAVSRDELTFDEWDTCVAYGDCPHIDDSGWGRGARPVINVTWEEARIYVAWLSKMTGKGYRLLSEAEYEYAARAANRALYPWGNDIRPNGTVMADCADCGSEWDGKKTAPIAKFPANGFGLFDMVGNVWEWVADCSHSDYAGAPADGSVWLSTDCHRRVMRGGSWYRPSDNLRVAHRDATTTDDRYDDLGFRVARTLSVTASGAR